MLGVGLIEDAHRELCRQLRKRTHTFPNLWLCLRWAATGLAARVNTTAAVLTLPREIVRRWLNSIAAAWTPSRRLPLPACSRRKRTCPSEPRRPSATGTSSREEQPTSERASGAYVNCSEGPANTRLIDVYVGCPARAVRARLDEPVKHGLVELAQMSDDHVRLLYLRTFYERRYEWSPALGQLHKFSDTTDRFRLSHRPTAPRTPQAPRSARAPGRRGPE